MAAISQHDRRRDWNAHARGGWVILFLWQGSRLSNSDVARLTGITRRGAQSMMEGLSAFFPILQDDSKKWYWTNKDS